MAGKGSMDNLSYLTSRFEARKIFSWRTELRERKKTLQTVSTYIQRLYELYLLARNKLRVPSTYLNNCSTHHSLEIVSWKNVRVQ